MMRRLMRLAMIAVFLLGCWQTQAQNLPPQYQYYIGKGDVDLQTGSFAYSNTDITIGPKDQGMSLTRYFGSSSGSFMPFGAGTAHSLEISLYRHQYHEPLDTPSTWHYEYYVVTGKTTQLIGYSNIPPTGTGSVPPGEGVATLISANGGINGPFVYTAQDGTTIEFPAITSLFGCPDIGFSTHTCTKAAAVTLPDGERRTFTYESFGGDSPSSRLLTVMSTRGYAVGFDYSTTVAAPVAKVCVVNLAVQYMAPTGPCPAGARSVTYGYEPSSTATTALLSFTDPASATTNYTYGANEWQMTGIRNPGSSSNDLTNSYDSTSKVSSQVYADTSTWTYSYELVWPYDGTVINEWTVVTDPLGHTERHDFGGCPPIPSSVTDGLGRATTYNCSGYLITRETRPEGNYVNYTYDSRGNRTETRLVAKAGSGLSDHVTQASFPATCATYLTCNKPDYIVDARGNRTDYTYSATHGGVLTETDPAPTPGAVRPQKRYTYGQFYAWYKNAAGTLVQAPTPIWLLTEISECQTQSSCAGTADEVLTTFTYGTPGVANNLLVTSKTVHAGDNSVSATTTWTYDDWGNQTSEDGPLTGSGDTTYTRYDADNRVIGTISPDPDATGPLARPATRSTYDSAGRLLTVETGTVMGPSDAEWAAFNPIQTKSTTYDVVGRPVKTTVSASGAAYAVTQTSYDAAWRPQCTAVRMDPSQWSAQTDACIPQTTSTNGPDRISKNVYDAAGQLTKVQRAYSISLLQQDYASYTYSDDGKRTSVTDADGNRSEMTYDGFDREVRLNFPSKTTQGQASAIDYEQYGYDENDNRTSLRKRDGQWILYSYDALNRMSFKDIPNGDTADVYYGYDLRGLRSYARFGSASGLGITNVFDALGRLTSTTNATGGISRTLSYQYDARGNRTRLTFPDGNYFTYNYDGLDRVTGILENGAASVAGFTYNSRGERSSLTGAVTTSYGYDAVSRLTSLTHDLVGTGQDVTYGFTQYNPANQVITRTLSNDSYAWAGAANLRRSYVSNGLNQYTNAGSLVLDYDANGNLTAIGGATLTYDVENRLVAVSGAKSASLSYDALGKLFQTNSGAAGATQFLYDGDALIAEYDASGNLKRRYVHGPGADNALLWYEGSTVSSATRRALRTDQQGTIVAVADSAGASIAINRYDEYGTPDPTNLGRFAYTGQISVPELGLYYYKARLYDPKLGRFLQTDPVGYDDDLDLYSYVKDDPLNNVDPEGQACTPLNGGSIYCVRRDVYLDFDRGAAQQTRFFGAAARTVEYLADNDIVGSSVLGPSTQAQQFLKQVSASLYSLNARAFSDIMAGRLSGPGLDDRMISTEQTRVQSMLDGLPSEARAAIVGSLNSAFASRVASVISGLNSHDSAYNAVLAGVAKTLGRPIDFGKQSDREAIGKALVRELRSIGACTRPGSRITTC